MSNNIATGCTMMNWKLKKCTDPHSLSPSTFNRPTLHQPIHTTTFSRNSTKPHKRETDEGQTRNRIHLLHPSFSPFVPPRMLSAAAGVFTIFIFVTYVWSKATKLVGRDVRYIAYKAA